MPVIRFAVSIEVESLDSDLAQERLLEYLRAGIQSALVRENICIGLLPPRAASTREKIETTLLGVEENSPNVASNQGNNA
jgi:hypothetical protein